MNRPQLEVADVVRAHAVQFLPGAGGQVSSARLRVLKDVEACRTVKLGAHVEECRDCGHRGTIAYNSCRNRHCPKCQGPSSAKWFDARKADLLPVEYFHVVFTLPEEVAEIALQNKREIYAMLFRAAARTLKEIAGDPKHLGAEIGFFAVLHTWGQNLLHQSKLELCRKLLGCAEQESAEQQGGGGEETSSTSSPESANRRLRCSACGSTALNYRELSRAELTGLVDCERAPAVMDSS